MEKMEDREQKFLSKIERKLEVTTEKLQEIRESFNQRITGVEEKLLDLEKKVDGKRAEPVRVVSEGTGMGG